MKLNLNKVLKLKEYLSKGGPGSGPRKGGGSNSGSKEESSHSKVSYADDVRSEVGGLGSSYFGKNTITNSTTITDSDGSRYEQVTIENPNIRNNATSAEKLSGFRNELQQNIGGRIGHSALDNGLAVFNIHPPKAYLTKGVVGSGRKPEGNNTFPPAIATKSKDEIKTMISFLESKLPSESGVDAKESKELLDLYRRKLNMLKD